MHEPLGQLCGKVGYFSLLFWELLFWKTEKKVSEQANFHYIVLFSKWPMYLDEFLKQMYLTSDVQPVNHDLTLNYFKQVLIYNQEYSYLNFCVPDS
jgi:hypothetical protein